MQASGLRPPTSRKLSGCIRSWNLFRYSPHLRRGAAEPVRRVYQLPIKTVPDVKVVLPRRALHVAVARATSADEGVRNGGLGDKTPSRGAQKGDGNEGREAKGRQPEGARGTRGRRRGGLQRNSSRSTSRSSSKTSEEAQPVRPVRLNKAIAQGGVASRRAADDLILSGKVAVNNKVVLTPGITVIPGKDSIKVFGKPVKPEALTKYYFAVNKPKGYLCANKLPSEDGRGKLVLDLFQEWFKRWRRGSPDPKVPQPRLFTVGRLDVASTGLLLVTNDGDWAQRVAHPSAGLTKEYVVTVDRKPSRPELETIASGTTVDGAFVQPEWVMPILDDPHLFRIRIVVKEGRNREVRNLVSNAGLDVTGLKRVRIGGYLLPKDLGLGQVRELKKEEVARVTDRGAQNNPFANPFAA